MTAHRNPHFTEEPRQEDSPHRWRRLAAWTTLATFIAQPPAALAQIVAAPSTPAANKPQVTTTASGLPLVQITAPSAAGVSRNQYQQFDVTSAGAVLNNSRTVVNTQLAGYVNGNPNLAGGTARIILNEVTSALPSSLKGYTEVAGDRAELVIANPNGITCNGCGFINTSRGVLTTGTPVMGASGSLDGFRVTSGQITIEGAGLNANNVDQLDLIARAVAVNAQIQANNLNVIAGANQFDYATLATQTIAGTGPAPTVAIDVAALGGMYANKIMLVGTEGGVGVRSLGTLATRSGDIVISSNGDLTLAGSVSSAANLALATSQAITTSATVYSQGDANVQAGGSLANTGSLTAGGTLTLGAASVTNSVGATLSADILHATVSGLLQNDGTITTNTLLTANAGRLTNTGQMLFNGAAAVTANSLTNSGILFGATGLTLDGGDINNSGTLATQGDLAVGISGTLTNSGALLAGGNGTLYLANLYNLAGAQIWASNNLTIARDAGGTRAAIVSNDRGSIEAENGDLTIKATQFSNLGADPTPYVTAHGVSDYIELAQNGRYAAALARAPSFYTDWVQYVPDLASYQSWLPYTGNDLRVQLVVNGTVQQLSPGFVAQPGVLHAGRDVILDVGNGTNQYSNITAGNNITFTGGTFTNTGLGLLSNVGIQPIYEVGNAGSDDWPDPHQYLPPLLGVEYHPGVPSIIGAGNAVNVTGLATFTNSNGQKVDGYVSTGTNSAYAGPGATPLILPGVNAPAGGLFIAAPSNNPNYLIETNALFASYSGYLNSGYFLQGLGFDPSLMEKRLGDGFYEQTLVRQEITRLTGRPYLYSTNHDADYQQLLDNAVRYAQTYHLTPGIALSAAQVALLTDDLVWLEDRVVNGQHVLVPQLYLAPNSTARLTATGGVVTGTNVNLSATTFVNSGTLLAKNDINLTATDIANQNGVISSGGTTSLAAGNDLTSQGGQIGGNQVNLSAGNDVNLNAAQVSAQTSLNATTGRDLNLGTITEQYRASGQQGQGYDESWQVSGTRQRLTTLQSNGSVTLAAGRDLTATGASVSAEGDGTLAAGRNVTLNAAEEQHQSHSERHDSGFWRSSSTTMDHGDVSHTGSTVSVGGRLDVIAGNDLTARGSNLVSQGDLTATAGNDLTLAPVTDTTRDRYHHEESRTGFFSSGASISFGTQHKEDRTNGDSTTQVGSTAGSVAGNVTLTAGNAYHQTASSVMAPAGDVTITAKQVDIDAAQNQASAGESHKESFTGITLSVSNPVVTAVQTAQQMSQAARQTKDPRMKALAAASTALAAKNAYDAVKAGQAVKDGTLADQAGGINVSLSVGSSHSESSSSQTSSTAAGSTVAAGNDVTIRATNGDLNVTGSSLTAGHDANLSASNNLNLQAAQNTGSSQSSSSSSSVGVGVGFSFGAKGAGIALQASASRSSDQGNGQDVTWTDTTVNAGNKASLASGNDTNLKGAVVTAPQVTADVGRNLNIQSLQDTSTYQESGSSAGFSVSVPIVGTNWGGNVSASSTKINSDYQSVTTPSGIQAGDKGFQVNVKGNTDLKGAVIASTQKAVDERKNAFTTTALAMADLQNRANYQARSVGINIGAGVSQKGELVPQGTSAGYGTDSGDASSVTRAGISGIAGNQDVRTGDGANALARIFDQTTVRNEINAQQKITQQFGQLASKAIGDYADGKLLQAQALRDQAKTADKTQADGLIAQAQALEDQWGDKGTMRLLAHTIIGGLTGGTPGAAGAAASTLAAPEVMLALTNAGVDPALTKVLTAIASTTLGAAVGGTAGAGAALNEVTNNALGRGLRFFGRTLIKSQVEQFANSVTNACGANSDPAQCSTTVEAWKNLSYSQMGLSPGQIAQWEAGVNNAAITLIKDICPAGNADCAAQVNVYMRYQSIICAGSTECIGDAALGAKLANYNKLSTGGKITLWIEGIGDAATVLGPLAMIRPITTATKGLGGVVDLAETGTVWGKGIDAQGKPFEGWVHGQLPKDTLDLNSIKTNFEAFDDYILSSKTAISNKTLDTTAVGYTNNPRSITSTLNGYLNKMVNFEGDGIKGQFWLGPPDITSKVMQLGIPFDTTVDQMAAIAKSIQYAATMGIRVVVTKLR